MPSTTRERLVEAAGQRFYRDGFRNVGVDQILSEVGISKTAFYKHFESKDDLVLEVLRQHDVGWRETFATILRQRGGDSPVGQLRALVAAVEHVISQDDFRGCFFVNVAMEFPLPHDPAHQAAAGNKRAIEEMVRSLAAQAGADDPQLLAEQLCLIMEGAYVTRQVTGNPRTAEVSRRLADMVIQAHVPAAQ